MPRSARDLLNDAMLLSEEERLDLAVGLLDSLTPAVPGIQRTDEEWIAEIERRVESATPGSGRPWAEVRAEIESRLGRK